MDALPFDETDRGVRPNQPEPNRYGDRQLNSAFYVVALARMCHHEPTKAYVARRRAEGKTDREIRRCLKRYIARRVWRLLEHQAPNIAA